MDTRGNIYSAAEDQIPAEDTARLEGYLHARAEETEKTARLEGYLHARAEETEKREAALAAEEAREKFNRVSEAQDFPERL